MLAKNVDPVTYVIASANTVNSNNSPDNGSKINFKSTEKHYFI